MASEGLFGADWHDIAMASGEGEWRVKGCLGLIGMTSPWRVARASDMTSPWRARQASGEVMQVVVKIFLGLIGLKTA